MQLEMCWSYHLDFLHECLGFLFSLLDSPSEVEPCLISELYQDDRGLPSSLCFQRIDKVLKFYYSNCEGCGSV